MSSKKIFNRQEKDHEAWLNLSLSTDSHPQPQLQPQPPAPALPEPIPPTAMPFLPPNPPLSSPQETHQEMFFSVLAPPPYPLPLPPPPPPPLSQLLDMSPQLIPEVVLPSQHDQDQDQDQDQPSSSRYQPRPRRLPVRARKQGKSETITPPYPWATSRRATVYSIEHLLSRGMNAIKGHLQCKMCNEKHDIEYGLQEKFFEVAAFIAQNKCTMHDRAPSVWMSPVLPNCNKCGEDNCLRPVFDKKREINWLFLLLGQMLGCCKLCHLKYFCKHTRNHRTGAKDRLLYLTYLGLCKQLDPNGPFNV